MLGKKQEEWDLNTRTIDNCTFCQKEATVNTNGSYVAGWISFVECSDFRCDARGPKYHTDGYSNDEYKNEDKAIVAWNKVIGRKK